VCSSDLAGITALASDTKRTPAAKAAIKYLEERHALTIRFPLGMK
jgi:hypothetical protein